jgi:Domain of unknown function (DUF1929)/FlgD Ig-like domain
MALLRGNGDSTWVLHWNIGSSARLWLAKPLKDTTVSIPVPIDTENSMNTFCAGQAVMPDGRLMVVGGTVVGTTGETRVAIFDPKSYNNSSRGWTVATDDTIKFGRWYASVTALGSGQMLATSGNDYFNVRMFGGLKTGSSDSLMNDFRALNLRRWLRWEDDRPNLGNRPEPRHGHSAVFQYSKGRTVFFGGVRKNLAGSQDSLLNEVRQIFVSNSDTGQQWNWDTLTVWGDPQHGYPRPRHRHTAEIVDNVMIVYGGLGKSSTGQDSVLSDVWRLIQNRNDTLKVHQWWRDTLFAVGPGARYGHTAIMDSIEDNGNKPAMIVYGGRKAPNSTFASDTVWKLRLDRADQAKPMFWQAIAWGGPGKREGHIAVLDSIDRHTSPDSHRVVVFGGEKDGEGLKNDAWALCRPEPGNAWSWHALEVDGTPPAPRKRHQAIYDVEWQRLLTFGGDTTLSAGGEKADLWSFQLDSGNPSWARLNQDNAPVARQGGAMIFDPRAVPATIPELYTNDVAGHDWDALDGAGRRLDNYPFMFQIKNGKVFYAGNGTTLGNNLSRILDPIGESWSTGTESGFTGGSAVLYYTSASAESVMKCGAPDHHDQTQLTNVTKAAVVDSTTGNTNWINRGNLPTVRRMHNLTIVPDGRVLMTGGRKSDVPEVYARTPFFYRNGNWEDADTTKRMAIDLTGRSYHSTSLLLPDARILSAAGPPVDDTLTATVFWPPYLFKNGTLEATRPSITSYPTHTVHYREPLYINIDTTGVGATAIDSIKILSLIHPGAVTHSFDMGQRFLSLPFSKTYGRLRTVLTGNANQLPPGDYLLFAVRSGVGGVPSVGKWIRVESETDATPPNAASMDVAVLGSTTYLFWGSQGDDGTGPGAATSWEIRSSSDEITDTNWNQATPFTSGTSRPANTTESVAFSSWEGIWYAVKIFDEWGNPSAVSNSVMDPGSGGGGLAARRAADVYSSAPSVGTLSTNANAAMLRLGSGEEPNGISFYNRGPNPLCVDSVTIHGARDRNDTLVYAVAGRLYTGIRRSPAFVRSSRAGELTAAFAESTGHTALPGDTLTARLGTGQHLWIETDGADPGNSSGASGIALEVSSGGNWTPSAVRYPVIDGDGWLEPGVAADSLRLVLRGGYTLKALSAVEPIEAEPAVHLLELQLEHSRIGPLDAATLANEDAVLLSGERLTVTFSSRQGGLTNDRVFAGFKTSLGTVPAARAQGVRQLPAQFALSQNEPNPFGDGTLIRFALPVKSSVTLDVFDVHGRRVKTLAKGEWPAGYHALEWNGRDAQGRRVSPGIYLYRMYAGPFHASRKLAVLP